MTSLHKEWLEIMTRALDAEGRLYVELPRSHGKSMYYPPAKFTPGWNPNENDKEIDLTNTATLTVTEPGFEPSDIKHLDVKPTDDGGFMVRVFYAKGNAKRTFHYVAASKPSLTTVLRNIAENKYINPDPKFDTWKNIQDRARASVPYPKPLVGTYTAKPLEDIREWL